jgi:hypothetical protein
MKDPAYFINLHANDFPIHMIMKPVKPAIQENIYCGLYGRPDEIVLASTIRYTYNLEMSNWETGDKFTLPVEYVTHHYQYSFPCTYQDHYWGWHFVPWGIVDQRDPFKLELLGPSRKTIILSPEEFKSGPLDHRWFFDLPGNISHATDIIDMDT